MHVSIPIGDNAPSLVVGSVTPEPAVDRLEVEAETHWYPEDVRLRPTASRQAIRARGIVESLILTRNLVPVGLAEFETWFWIHTIIEMNPAQRATANNAPTRAGKKPDPRRGPDGLGGFLLGLTLYGMSYRDIVDLVYAAALNDEWHPWAPIRIEELQGLGWYHAGHETQRAAARERFEQTLRKLAERSAKVFGIERPRGGNRKKIRR